MRATDERGLVADQSYTLTVSADTQPPSVSVIVTPQTVTPGQSVTIQLLASDNVGINALTLQVEGVPLVLDEGNSALYTAMAPGLLDVAATATDAAGNVAAGTATLRVIDATDTEPPFVEITSPASGAVVTYLTDIVGTVTDPNLEFYRLEYALAGTDQWTTFHESFFLPSPGNEGGVGGGGVVDDVLGVFDPTMLANDIYDIRLVAQDTNGNIWREPLQLSVEGNAKLGNFRLEFEDLNIPLAGIAIQIKRVYDTLDASYGGDFGFGWHLETANPRIRETVRVSAAEQAGVDWLFGANPFRQGTRVYLTNPEGRRVGFTFDPVPEPGLFGIWRPRFTADPGVYDQLHVEDFPLSQRANGTFLLYLYGLPYNPSEYALTTKDGTVYRYDQFDGLIDITNRNDVVLTFSDSGIFSSVGESIQWTRDDQGRISQIVDPDGNPARYEYNAAGELVAHANQVNDTSTYSYLEEPAHYLARVTCPLLTCVTRADFDEAGRVVASHNALGNPATQSYDLQNHTEIVADRLGNETTLVFDDRGNITTETDSLGHTTHYEYDANDNVTSVTDARGHQRLFAYDLSGNVISLTDPLGNATTITYNGLGVPTVIVDSLGRTRTRVYDDQGNLAEEISPIGDHAFFSYDAMGRTLTSTDYRGNEISFDYGTLAAPTRVTDPEGGVTVFEYAYWGAATRVVDGSGNETRFEYDAAGHPLSVRDALGNSVQYAFQADRLTTTTDRMGRTTSYQYDAGGRPTKVTDPREGVTQYTYDANGNLLSVTDPEGHTTSYAYRADGLVAAVTINPTTSYEYDEVGNLVSVTDGKGHTTSFEYDAMDRVTKRTDAHGGVRSAIYDAAGNLVSETNENGNTTSYAYDDLNRLVSTNDAAGGVVGVTYDADGNVTSHRSAGSNELLRVRWPRLPDRPDRSGGRGAALRIRRAWKPHPVCRPLGPHNDLQL